jgi:hypothetical protein
MAVFILNVYVTDRSNLGEDGTKMPLKYKPTGWRVKRKTKGMVQELNCLICEDMKKTFLKTNSVNLAVQGVKIIFIHSISKVVYHYDHLRWVLLYITEWDKELRGHIVLNVHASNGDKSDDTKDSFHENLECVFNHFFIHLTKMLDFGVKVVMIMEFEYNKLK